MSDPVLEAMAQAGWGDKPEDLQPDPRYPAGESLHEQKVKAETRRIDIQNAISMNHLMSRKLAMAMMDAVGQEIKTSFVDLPRRCSSHMASMAEKPSIEREFEKYLAEYVSRGILNVKVKVQEMCEAGFFENILDEI